MKPFKILAKEGDLTLSERDGVFVIRANGVELMSSARHGSEEAMAEPLTALRTSSPRVLIGGLGLGYTLRAALDVLPQDASVVVAELSPAVARWCQNELKHLARDPCADSRVRLAIQDVATVDGRFDAILLDVDNGPRALSAKANARLYDAAGISRLHGQLKAHGLLVVWSAGPDERFARRLSSARFAVEERAVKARAGGKSKHHLFIARR